MVPVTDYLLPAALRWPPARPPQAPQFIVAIDTFSIAAKQTHTRYGPRSHAANGDTRENPTITIAIVTTSAAIIATPSHGERIAKNATDHNAFSTNCATNSTIIGSANKAPKRLSARRRLIAKAASDAEAAIITYSIVHTGPNNHAGGVHAGFASSWYQSPTELLVAAPPIAAAANTSTLNTITVGTMPRLRE